MKTDAKINVHGGTVSIHLTFGFACVGSYEATLYDANNKNGETFETGASSDPSPEVVTLPADAGSLVNRTVVIDGALVPPNPPDMVSLKGQVYQDGTAIVGAVLESKASVGPGEKATPMLMFRFVAA